MALISALLIKSGIRLFSLRLRTMPSGEVTRKAGQGIVDGGGWQGEGQEGTAACGSDALGLGAEVEGDGGEAGLPGAAEGEAPGFGPDRGDEGEVGALGGDEGDGVGRVIGAGDEDAGVDEGGVVFGVADEEEV